MGDRVFNCSARVVGDSPAVSQLGNQTVVLGYEALAMITTDGGEALYTRG